MKKFILIIFTALTLNACSSAKVIIADSWKNSGFKSLAVLPVEYPAEIQREKVDAIYEAVQLELKNAGFIVLADKLVRETCSSPSCPERGQLAAKYSVDGFASLEVKSVSRTNFLLGFYNTTSAKLLLSDKTSEQIAQVEARQSERGGLIFNSGQILRGLLSYAENTEQASFEKLSNGLARAIASKVPRSQLAVLDPEASSIKISAVEVKEVKPQVFEICSKSAENLIVSAIINRQKTNLREVQPTKYCGQFLLDTSSANNSIIKIEARSAYGSSVQSEVDLAKYSSNCNLKDRVILKAVNGKPAIELACSQQSECQDALNSCSSYKILVFRAESTLGPFQKVAELRGRSWTDDKAVKGRNDFYQLVSVSKSGVWSLPEAAKPASNEG